MPQFKDTAGRTWTIALNIAVAKRVRDEAGIDLLDKDLPKVLQALFEDTIGMCNVLFVVADENARASGLPRVTDEEFGRSLSGDPIDEGGLALLHAIRDFTPNPRSRARVEKLIAAMLDALGTIQDQADGVIAGAIEKLRAEVTGGTFSSSPQSPASSRGTTPSGS